MMIMGLIIRQIEPQMNNIIYVFCTIIYLTKYQVPPMI